MVKLYGVEHAMTIAYGFLLLQSRNLPVIPSDEFFADLESLPKESRIGVETFNEKDWQDINDHVKLNAIRDGFFGYPYYDNVTDSYWRRVIDFCKIAGHDVVFLEDKETWKRYNKTSFKLAKCRSDELYFEDGESDYHYHGKLCRHNEREYKTNIKRREIHEIDRDIKLLEAIKSNSVDVAIVGLGHSDYWIANQNRIRDGLGIAFESYSTDTAKRGIVDQYSRFAESIFKREAIPDPRRIYERESLERVIRLIEQGRIILDRVPDYVGIWEIVCCPSKGYFEMFVEDQNDGKVSGTIEDSLGSARFEGELTPTNFNFVKQYVDSEETAIQQEIPYKSTRQGKEFYGHFFTEGIGSAFYMTESAQENPVKLSLRWHKLIVDKKKVN